MAAFGWTVLALVFLDELLAVAAAAVWGGHVGGPVLAVLAGVLTMTVWFLFASPRARYGGAVVRPVTKVLVFALAAAGLWAAGHHGWAVALSGYSAVVNGLAQLPGVRSLTHEA